MRVAVSTGARFFISIREAARPFPGRAASSKEQIVDCVECLSVNLSKTQRPSVLSIGSRDPTVLDHTAPSFCRQENPVENLYTQTLGTDELCIINDT